MKTAEKELSSPEVQHQAMEGLESTEGVIVALLIALVEPRLEVEVHAAGWVQLRVEG